MGSVHGSFFLLTAPDRKEESSEQPLLGELTVTGVTPDSLHLSWTVAQGPFDSFVIQYKDAQGQPQTVPVAGDENEVTVPGLESNRKYKMNLYGLRGRQRVGPVSVVAKTGESEPTLLAPGPRQGCPPTPPSISAVLLLRPLPPSSQPLFCPHVHPVHPGTLLAQALAPHTASQVHFPHSEQPDPLLQAPLLQPEFAAASPGRLQS